MQITHQYYYRKGKATAKAVIYAILSVLLVAFAVFSYVHWELSFMFTDWHGYVLIIPYFMITLGIILSVFENFKKAGKTNRGIPAFAVGEDCFVLYDNTGMANVIPFEECDKVRIKRTYSRIRGTQLYLIIKYHDRMDVPSTFKVDLSELDRPQSEIDKQLKKIYNNYKKEHNIQ
ncbi:MAG: hypothetical protein IJK68_04440 [Muribaculaceae bacterium]|nr:hypothetical protein [Muribaculaceae bacterium]MBR0023120.1 hypothetical protein [Muribaculaceae bacterium]